ncbi:hypothetical protein HanIR_Chr12g0568901 [Helianthus annuus]|uniref:uncharacterized protein LOC110894119 isoform X3 n=1 Tax=Helianthus annuus TaxID=4232 RepID=UPI000B8FFE8D|nr:uncharacterized protein LOC110894119 isoform X3 [Helianthus annuus]XP_021996988.1 uncharacterized protein LOC110894119 isoform X3 [Helianthus annuus]KAJ0491900.1 hypothetical protein HanIR_Chr12g0568901 [Helianthus annuus]
MIKLLRVGYMSQSHGQSSYSSDEFPNSKTKVSWVTNEDVKRGKYIGLQMYRMVKTTDRAPASSGQFIFAKTLHPGIIMMICYLTFVTHEPKNDQLKDRGRSRFYQEKYYQYGAILQGVKYIENEQCS